jgi:adenylate kinase
MCSFTINNKTPIDAILLLGPTGVGKSPLGDTIALRGLFLRTCHHLDFGSELRRAVSGGYSSAPYSSQELEFIHGVLERGLLLENEHFPLAEKIISLYLARVGFAKNHLLILNGIPRHEGQARDLERTCRVSSVVMLDCCADDVLCRISSNVGGDRTERIDDTVELIKKKLVIFTERTAPLIDFYEGRGARIYRLTIDKHITPAAAYDALLRLTAAHPPVAFVAEPPER